MKITGIETLRVGIPFDTGGLRQGMRPGLTPWKSIESLLLRIETDDGLVGWGEGFGHFVNPATDAVIQTLIGPWFLERDTNAVGPLMDEASRSFFGFGRGGPVQYALSAFDIALWDIAAKRAGVPLFRMLGGECGLLKRYASLMRYGGDLQAVSSNCVKARDAGYSMIKLHERELPAFMAARESVGIDVEITVDVNCPWSVAQARDVARQMRGHGFRWLEEPVWPPDDFEGLAKVREEGVAIAAGENIGTLHEFRRCFDAGAVDVAQPSVAKLGGITPMLEVISLAESYDIPVVPHSFYWGPGYLATAHVAASMREPCLVETTFVRLERKPYALFDPETPALTLSEAPGLGFDLAEGILEEYRMSRARIAV